MKIHYPTNQTFLIVSWVTYEQNNSRISSCSLCKMKKKMIFFPLCTMEKREQNNCYKTIVEIYK